MGRVLATAVAAVFATFGFTSAAAGKAPVFKVLDGRIDQRVEVNATHFFVDECWEVRLIITGTSDYALQAERGAKVKLEPSGVLGSHQLTGVRFTGAGENGLAEEVVQNGPFAEGCDSPPPREWGSESCGAEEVSPPITVRFPETAKGTGPDAFHSKGGGFAPFGAISDLDGTSSSCYTGSRWGPIAFPAPSKTKRKDLVRADDVVKLKGAATYSGSENFADCFCDRIEGYQDVDISWALKLKRLR